MATSAVAVGSTAAGALLIWSGLRGASVLKTFQEVIQGKKPSGQNVYPVGTPKGGTAATAATGATGDASGMVALALSQVGVREGAGNAQKYTQELGRGHGEAWCADFIDWLGKKTGNSDVLPQTASAPGMAQAFGARFRMGTAGIEPGDIVFQHGAANGWNGIGHVGICVSSTQMVAGNYGDHVAQYAFNTSKTVGYAKPGYKGK